MKRPNSNYDIFVEKRAYKEREHECLKVCETNQGSNGSSSNITMINLKFFLPIKSKINLSLTYEEQ